MDIVGKIFSVLFLAECLAKILALGFISGHHAYLQEAWNYLDLLVVIVGIMEFFDIDGSGSLRSYTALALPSTSRVCLFPHTIAKALTRNIGCMAAHCERFVCCARCGWWTDFQNSAKPPLYSLRSYRASATWWGSFFSSFLPLEFLACSYLQEAFAADVTASRLAGKKALAY